MSHDDELHSPTHASKILDSSLFSGILLSYWDNIMGPRVSMLWQGNNKLKVTKEIVSFVSSHTLNGELCRAREEGATDRKFYVLSDRGYIFSASIFLGNSGAGQTVFSLSFIIPIEDMKIFLDMQHFLNKQIGVLVMQLRMLQEKNLGDSVDEFDFYLKQLITAVETLEKNRISQPHICIKDTAFSNNDLVVEAKLDDPKFLMRAITSHLQTGGSSIVIGKQKEAVDIMVNTLAMFLKPSERACSRATTVNASFGYQRDLFVQGLLVSQTSGAISMESKDVILNSFPTTLINVNTKDVQQTGEMQVHFKTRLEFLKLDLQQIMKEEEIPLFPTKGLFHRTEDIAIMVQHFVSELLILPNLCSAREIYRDDFLKLLQQKSNTLFSYIEAKSLRGVDPFTHADIRQMKIDLSLNSEADFRIVLAEAEKLHPGLVSFLFQDPGSGTPYQGGDIAQMLFR